ncbi:hypothetical protein [Arthrobacter sp. efr-133-TYG-104]|uniref:hypothetical protein n=1 Tax=Arthrobacter sp. efr-133-TYG-104 TaxID=3040324 RepID=UPI00255018DA|nr:hypothetical protein [Arthrobacter sp. efr-133-TYG-104]
MSSRRRLPRLAAIGVAVVVALFAAPAAALAAFTTSDAANPQYSAARLAAPASANVSMSCTANNRRATVTVNSFSTVTYANYHEIKVYNRSHVLEFTGDLSTAAGKTYTSGIETIGTWTYEIRGYYKIPGTSRMWTGTALTGSLVC